MEKNLLSCSRVLAWLVVHKITELPLSIQLQKSATKFYNCPDISSRFSMKLVSAYVPTVPDHQGQSRIDHSVIAVLASWLSRPNQATSNHTIYEHTTSKWLKLAATAKIAVACSLLL